MTSKPLPLIPSAQPPQIKGLAPKPLASPESGVPGAGQENKDISSSDMTPQVVYPQALSNGDILLGVMEQLPLHSIRLIKRTDPSQKIPFLMDCKCGSQARIHTEDALKEAAACHLALRAFREIPK